MKNSKGFTLIELILGLSIFSITALLIYGTFSGGIRVSRQSDQHAAAYREARWALDLMAKELENMAFYDFSNSYPDRAAFKGGADQLNFILPTDHGLQAVSYYLASPDDGRVHTVIIGDTHSQNVTVQTGEESAARVHYLVRQAQPLIQYLNDEPLEDDQIEILSMNMKEGRLRFSYQYPKNSGKDVPSNVMVEADFFLDEGAGETITLTRNIFVPLSWR